MLNLTNFHTPWLLFPPSQIVCRFREKKLSQIICRFTLPMQH